ncbi:hypothetical protein BU23DRAFT_653745 [Bimuria novae-zelandiae CBS 107.79]|uniref:SnoaL-like domain-containing protein n=1 Tax=Bimuria novae-zelandiae CBS 107.79 TaxID=1447943 RepID=A0A6A5UVS2_9PLEO|nr:hypothetical protein BU23DRAFT_653745 [Bimuria novae-zelandiae CBS 107.79]
MRMENEGSDIPEIANLLKRERYYRDTAQWDLCRAAFHPDGSKTYVNVAWYEGDVEVFLHKSAIMHKSKVNIIHSSFDPVDIRVHGRRAISEAFCLVTSGVTIGGVEYELASHMRLASRLEKITDNGPWRMLSLESTYVRDRLVTAFPGPTTNPPLVMSSEMLEYPKGYRHLAMVMLTRGLKPRTDLPHEDDQEGIQRIFDRNRAFLEGYHSCG